MRKSNLRLILSLLAVMLFMAVFPMTALASGGDDTGTELPIETPTATVKDEPQETTVPVEATGGLDDFTLEDLFGGLLSAFSPSGNLTLIDDFCFEDTDSNGDPVTKQFITVQSKTGNYFFIIIDRAGDTENVYFLNMVDEADLMALIDEPEDVKESAPLVCTCDDKCYAGHVDISCPVCAVNLSECTGKEPRPEPTPAPDEQEPKAPEKKSIGNPALVIVLVLALIGGAAYYFLKVKGKARPKTKGSTDLDEYDYGDGDGDEYAYEPYDREEEDTKAPGDDGT